MLKVLFNNDGTVIGIRNLLSDPVTVQDGQWKITGKGINILYVSSTWPVVDVVRVCTELVAQSEVEGCIGDMSPN